MTPDGWRLAAFVALFFALQFGYTNLAGGALERFVIERLTVPSAAALLNSIDPQLDVAAQGSRLVALGGGLNVRGGCEGSDVALLLVGAMAVAPLAWPSRVVGAVLGLALVFALNQARVIALFHAFRSDRAAFDLLHGLLLPLLMVFAAAVFFLFWVGRRDTPKPE